LLKAKYEEDLERLSQSTGASIVCGRAWSVSGELVTKRDSFAFSNIIDQATAGRVTIESTSLVYRRFCALDDFLGVLASAPVRSGFRMIDSGGPLLEIKEFADLVISEVNPAATLETHANRGPVENRYHSNNATWAEACMQVGLVEQTLLEQIKVVARPSD
jgi:aspartate-semialdehyde dehydrogenase